MRNVITLSNGKKVGNFSSPHPFTFEDGSVLPAIEDSRSEELSVEFIEHELPQGDIELSFNLTPKVNEEVIEWCTLCAKQEVDIVFCPLPMITALKEVHGKVWLLSSPFRAVRMTDRISKLVSIHKQCV